MTFGISAQGFTRPRLADLNQRILDTMVSKLGSQLNTLPESVISQLVGVFAGELDLEWQAMEDVYFSQYPDLAFGVSLDNAASLSGAVRKGALPSRFNSQLLFGSAGTLIPGGSQIAVEGSPTSIFSTDFDVTLVAGQDAEQTLTPTAVPTSGQFKLSLGGQTTDFLQYNALAADIQTALQALEFGAGILVTGNWTSGFTVNFAGASGKQVQAALVVSDNTLGNMSGAINVAVTIIIPGTNQGLVSVTAIETGPTLAPAGFLNTIVTPISGWTSTINKLDATVGRNTETDNEFKQRRREELQLAGAATLPAIRSRLLELSGVSTALVFENDTMITDLAGRPPKSIEAVVDGGDDQEIWDKLFDTKAGGIKAYGTTCGIVVDQDGQSHDVCFSRPTQVLIYIKITIVKNSFFPANGVATVQQELVAFGNALGIGKEVVTIPYLISAIANIPGIEDADLLIGTAPNPTSSDNVPIAANEVAVFDTSRVQVITI